MAEPYVLAIDQGSSATKSVLVSADGAAVSRGSAPVGRSFPRPGWVEQDPAEIWSSVCDSVRQCLGGRSVSAVGLSTQRESLLLWERATGRPVSPLVTWQDRRTADECARLRETVDVGRIREISGLPLDPMFSAAKARWLLDHYAARDVCLGTVDSWLVRQLCGVDVIEVGNASRTQLMDVRSRSWSPWLLELFGVPVDVLPSIVPSTGPFGPVRTLPELAGVPVAGVLGDSHAALFANGAASPGPMKATYGTGSSVMGLVDGPPSGGLCLTVAWDDGFVEYAAEGNILSTGATIAWLAELLGRDDIAGLAASADSDGVHVVPAFGGLAAPWWDPAAVGTICGLTLGTRPEQLARAALESIAFQIDDVVSDVDSAAYVLADGGAAANDQLMQLQADTSQLPVYRSRTPDLCALGAAHLAGRTAGLWSAADVRAFPRPREEFHPIETSARAAERKSAWHTAVARSRGHSP